jgi:parallel beta-helix repeat protein
MLMNKRYKLLLILFTIIFVFSSFASVYRILPTVRATYVEGTITQDTDWTLVDSPFIVSNNVIVNPGVTLTIEPGVQVRFGENFSITVNGRIVADGTGDRMIRFTSDSLNASTSDWGTILINGTQQSSITHCVIEYGADGVTLESGSLNLGNNFVRFNSNGITVTGGSIIIENNEIANNTIDGINLAGDSQVTIENNLISSNGDGIVLAGNLTGTIDITQNNILLNGQSGIVLGADAFSIVAILQNNVSLNNNGFSVTTNASTYITRNYISNNTKGIFYENGIGHEAHFNDIYNNTVGVDVSPTASVNATYNYWGDESGPFQSSLNPGGRGNSVGGNGVNLDFIFFLSAPINYNNAPPTAILQTDKTLVAPNQNVTFIGTNSYDDRRVDQYFFDFGDGANSGWTTLSLFNHTYSTDRTYIASLKVIDDFNTTSQDVATTIAVQDLTPLSVSMTLGNEVADYNGNVTVTVYVSNGFGGVDSAGVTLFSLKGGTFSPAVGVTNATGYFETTFTAPNVTDVSYVRLIATATEAGYADGSCHEYLKVLPMLHTQLSTNPATVKSEATVAAIFHVTNGLGQPVINASLTEAVDNGTLSAGTGITGTDGSLTLNFTAPYTLSPVNVTITVTAQHAGYTDGYDQETITVLQNVLAVELTPNLDTITSEGNTTVTALVTCDANPVPNANVTVSSGSTGNFTSTAGITDSNGVVAFIFTAPQTTSTLNATVTATATKSHYIDGANQTVITIVPKVLIVYLTADNYATISESNVSVTVHVTYNLAPVQNVNVAVTSENGGNFSQPNGTTDAYGFAYFVFTTPQANAPTDIVIKAQCSKTGYADGQDSLTLTDNAGNMSVQVTASSYAIMPDNSAILTISATSNSRPVVGAQVIISTSAGNFSVTTGFTEANGTCTFVFNAPSTTVQLPVVIIANVTKNGYIGNGNQTTINVTPVPITHNEGGWPLVTMLLIIIPVIIAVIVVVLIKLKVIVVSTGEESAEE